MAEFDSAESNLPEYLKDVARFCYITGWRRQEAATLTWQDIDGEVIRLQAVNAKIRVARSVLIGEELAGLIERCRHERQVKKPDGSVSLCGLIFHRDGQPIGDFRKAWHTACVMARTGKFDCRDCGGDSDASYKCLNCGKEWMRDELKYVGRIFHDFHRTAVRNMARGGVPEGHAMSISGHKTPAPCSTATTFTMTGTNWKH